ncbi:methyltransferase domain-containing protein [Aquisalimonas sp.]|uniref:methyltransferase domain-containing protein n=1 Tax=Aquisalimonas sp. TaxID=1872621 RepID=UPI0025C4F1E8|nr:methyltransferase domain-containing protein [Aquisalimonas sp.]
MATSTQAIGTAAVDRQALEEKVKAMYHQVAENPHGDFHFALGRGLAEELGYPPQDLDRIPAEAIDSFAGVGNPVGIAGIQPGDVVLDLGSGSGLDVFLAALYAGPDGRVLGVDMTEAQRLKAQRLADAAGFDTVSLHAGYIESLPFDDASVDVVISNGVINLSADKARVFAEAARVLKPGGRLAIADIVSESRLPEQVKCDATLWAACIGGAAQQDEYQAGITAAGLQVRQVEHNSQYQFLTDQAVAASRSYGVKSINLLATKPA